MINQKRGEGVANLPGETEENCYNPQSVYQTPA